MIMPGKSSIGFSGSKKLTFLRFFENFEFFMRNSFDHIPMLLARPVSSTSPPGGNQVDGLPPASSTETVAKRARVEPRTQVHVTLQISF